MEAARHGFDAIEILGEPDDLDVHSVQSRLADTGLAVSALTAASRLATGRDLSHPDPAIRTRTLDHFKRCIDVATVLGAPVASVTLTAVGRYWHEAGSADERDWAIDGLAALAAHARGTGVRIAVEVLNRYTSSIANTPAEMASLIARADGDLGLSIDLFHLVTEVRDPVRELAAAPLVLNVQIAEADRTGPGELGSYAHRCLEALAGAGYHGAVALEAFPAGTRPYAAVEPAARPATMAFIDRYVSFVRDALAISATDPRLDRTTA